MVPRPSAGDEQQAPLPLQVLGVGDRVIRGGRDCGRGRNNALSDTDDCHRLEFQAFHAVHRANADRFLARSGAQRDGRDTCCLQGCGSLLAQVADSRGDADGVRLDAFALPAADAFD